ncbi:MAG: hypothetical protein LBL57_08385, partial [Tannerella sp.]|nr:hypothetical protein [Tannerella sp.]
INKNPGGMACKISFLTWHPDGIPGRHGHDFLPIWHPSGILYRHGWDLFATDMPSLRDFIKFSNFGCAA